MKLVTAVIKPHMWDAVRDALEAFGVNGMTVTETGVVASSREAAVAATETPSPIPTIASVRSERRMPLEELFVGPGKTRAEPDDLVVEVRLPRRGDWFQAFAKFGSPNRGRRFSGAPELRPRYKSRKAIPPADHVRGWAGKTRCVSCESSASPGAPSR